MKTEYYFISENKLRKYKKGKERKKGGMADEIDIEQVCAFKWDLRKITKPFGLKAEMSPEYSKELAFYLGLLLPSDGFATITIVPEPVLPVKRERCAFLMFISAEIDHTNSRRCIPSNIITEIREEYLNSDDPDLVAAATEEPENIRLIEHFTAVIGAFEEVNIPDYVMLVNGNQNLGKRVLEWLQRRFDCYMDDNIELDPVSLKSLAVRWSLLAFNSGLPGTLRILLSPGPAVTGISEVWMEFQLDAIKKLWDSQIEEYRRDPSKQPSSGALIQSLAVSAAGVVTDKLGFEGFSTPVATLTVGGRLEILSPDHALMILKDLSTVV